MPYEILEKKISTLPEEGLKELSHYIDYLCIVYEDTAAIRQTEKKNKLASKTQEQIRAYMTRGKSIPAGISTVDYIRNLRAD